MEGPLFLRKRAKGNQILIVPQEQYEKKSLQSLLIVQQSRRASHFSEAGEGAVVRENITKDFCFSCKNH